MKILFISTHNFATNPRLVKEIDLALANKYQVSVLCCEFDNWSKDLNEKIKQRLLPQIQYFKADANRRPLIPWLLSSFWFLFSKTALSFLPNNIFLLSLRSNKRSWLLLKKLNEFKNAFNLVVAHNPGAFYPAMQFAKKQNIPSGMDIEDYHPGEVTDVNEARHLRSLSKKILPTANYITAASAPILEKTIEDTEIVNGKISVVLNLFSGEEFIQPVKSDSYKLKIVWFSQNIAEGRGLEEVIPVITQNNNVELHLYGNLKKGFYQKTLTEKKNIFIHEPLLQAELHKELRLYDAALALENPASNFNRELCITNKLLAYYQAGLYIIASDTIAQQEFINNHPEHGIITKLDENALASSIQNIYSHKALIRGAAKHRFERSRMYNWENESKKLLQIWKEVSN